MSVRLFALDKCEIVATWDDYAHLFERFARTTGEISPAQVRERAESGHLQIWGMHDAERVLGIATTEICETAGGRICVVRIACGEADVKMQERLLDEIGKWARQSERCSCVRYYGRRGWLRRFPRFRQTGVIAEWPLGVN